MQAHEQRVIDECNELREKSEKLAAFCNGQVFKNLPDIDQQLLMGQLSAMNTYEVFLQMRIGRFG